LPVLVARFRTAAFITAAFAGILGTLALLSWITDIVALRSLLSQGITMKTNAALGLMFVAAAILLLNNPAARPLRRFAGNGSAFMALLIGALTLTQYATGRDLGIDQLLFREPPGSPATFSPNRMGLPGATSLLLLGAAVLLRNVQTPSGRRITQYLAIIVGLVVIVPLLGYAYSVENLYSRPGKGIAAQTAISLLLLAFATLAMHADTGAMKILTADGPGGVLARRMILPSILIPVAFGWLRTIAEQQGLVNSTLGRTLLVLSLVVVFTSLVWSSAHALARLGQERLRAQEALRESEHRFRVALNTAPISVYTNDLDLRYTWIQNPRPGFSAEAMLGKRDDELLPPDSVADLVALKRQVLATGRGDRRQIAATIDGAAFVYDVTVEPLRASDGSIAGLTVATSDVTAIKQQEQALRRAMADADAARAAAEAASAAKDQFLAVLSHELRTPLTPVMALIQMLETDTSLPAHVRESLFTIRRNVELEARLIDDLLDLTRVARGKLTLRVEDVDLHDLLRHVVGMCRPDADAKQHRLDARLAPQPFIARGDPARLQQVFWNLLKNSIKFTPAAGAITVATEPAPGGLQITFRDSGIGIDAQALPRIFNAFEQGDSQVARQFGGLGLGLAIAKAIVTMHRGTIAAASGGPGAGTVITVVLPAVPAPAAAPPVPPPPDLGGDAFRGLRVLIVEDNADTARALTRLLAMFGCRVTAADSVRAGAAALQSQPFDLLLSDLGLPDGTGHDLMPVARTQPALKAVAVSGFGMEHDVRKSLDAGFSAHLTKPVDIGLLRKTLADVLKTPAPPEVAPARLSPQSDPL
jgi:PAS domain S-box-containing protein